jgi:hypothetical protein
MSFSFYSDGGAIALDHAQSDDLVADMVVSVSIKIRTWYMYPSFGIDLSGVQQHIPGADALLRDAILAATKWILSAGKAIAIECICEYDENDESRINYKITAFRANKTEVSFKWFYKVT